MAKSSAAHTASRMPKNGVQYPKGKAKTTLASRMRRAFHKVKIKQLA